MNILIVCTLYPPYVLGGAEISTSMLAEGLASKGIAVTVLTTGKENKREVINNVTIYRIKNKNIYWRYPQREKPLLKKAIWHFIDMYNPLYSRDIRRIIDVVNPDVIHSGNLCGLSSVVWDIAHGKGIPLVHTLRDYYLLCPYQTMCKNGVPCVRPCKLCKSYSVIKKAMSHKVNAVVGISNFILKQHLECGLFKNAQIKETIANSVEYNYVETRNKGNNIVGYLGRISPEKGIELLIEAFLKSQNCNRTLLIAGTGNSDYVNELQSKYAGKQIKFIGKVNSVSFLQDIDLLVVPSLWNEPFGRVVIEAYSQHVPVFMSNNGGLKELACEGIGWTFETADSSRLTNLLNDFYKGGISVVDENFEKSKRFYSKTYITHAYMDLYKEVIESFSVDS